MEKIPSDSDKKDYHANLKERKTIRFETKKREKEWCQRTVISKNEAWKRYQKTKSDSDKKEYHAKRKATNKIIKDEKRIRWLGHIWRKEDNATVK